MNSEHEFAKFYESKPGKPPVEMYLDGETQFHLTTLKHPHNGHCRSASSVLKWWIIISARRNETEPSTRLPPNEIISNGK